MAVPADMYNPEDSRNQAVVDHMDNAAFLYTDEHGNDATNTLKGGAAWARTRMAALDSSMPAEHFAGMRGYHVIDPKAVTQRDNAVGLYYPSHRMTEFRMAYPIRDESTEAATVNQQMRDQKFREAFVHEHGHHVDNMYHGDMQGNTIGHLEARAETYAQTHSRSNNFHSVYDQYLENRDPSVFRNDADPEGWQSMADYENVRAGGDMPTQPRRSRMSNGTLVKPNPGMMPRKKQPIAAYMDQAQ